MAWKMDKGGGHTVVLCSQKLCNAFYHSLYHNQVHCHTTGGNIIGIIILMQECQMS